MPGVRQQKPHTKHGLPGLIIATALALALPGHPALAQDEPDGEQIYASNRCVTCHGERGQGTIGVALAGNSNLADMERMLDQIINGGNRMPAFGDQFSNAEIAAVATYVRTHFGNEFEAVTAEDVEEFRSANRLR